MEDSKAVKKEEQRKVRETRASPQQGRSRAGRKGKSLWMWDARMISQSYGHDAWGNMTHRYGWGGEVQGGGAGQSSDKFYTYSNNRRTDGGFTYNNSGDLTFDGGQHFTFYDT